MGAPIQISSSWTKFCGELNAPIYPSCGSLIVKPENSGSVRITSQTPDMFIDSYDHMQIIAYITFTTGEATVSVGEDAIISNKKLFQYNFTNN